MIGLDTNILVRLLVADDPAQTESAKRFVRARCTRNSPAFINSVVLAELVWVLERSYKHSRSEIATAIEALLAGDDRLLEHRDEVRAGLTEYKSGRIGLTDAIIARINRKYRCEATVTFDRRAAKLDGFLLVD